MLTLSELWFGSGPFGQAALVITVVQCLRLIFLWIRNASIIKMRKMLFLGALPLILGVIGLCDGHMIVARQLAAAAGNAEATAMILRGAVEANYPLYIGIVGTVIVETFAAIGLSRSRGLSVSS